MKQPELRRQENPAGFATWPNWSAVFGYKYGRARFCGTPRLAAVKSVNKGATSAASPVKSFLRDVI